MINDWVFDKRVKLNTQVIKIGLWDIQGAIHLDSHHCDFFEPIPLTEEILKKNGFVSCSNNRYMNMSNGVDIIFRKNYIRVCVGSNKIDIRNKGVHSFQQILRLLDKRELADNFKI